MSRRVQALILFAVIPAFCLGEPPVADKPKTEAKPAATTPAPDASKVGADQELIASKYQNFERDLLRVAQKLEKQGIEGQSRAMLIRKALQQARERKIGLNLSQLSTLLKSPEYKNLQKAIDEGATVKADLERLLAMLNSQDIKDTEKWLKETIAMLNQAIIMQGVAKARNQSSTKEDAAKSQKAASDQVSKILERIEARDKAKKEQSPEDDKAKGKGKEGKDPKDADPSKKPNKGDGKEGDPKKGQGEPKEGDGEKKQGQQKKDGEEEEKEQQETTPGRKKVQDANDYQKKAEEGIEKDKRSDATEDQEAAKKKLEEAKKQLEEILRQLREEEIERMLADLRARCEKMLRMQEIVYEGTKKIDQKIQLSAEKKASREEEQDSRLLTEREEEIILEVEKALKLLEGEGSAVAFPEVFEQVRNDMIHVSRRLARTDVAVETQTIEEDIIATLKEMIEALKKAQQDMQNRKSGQAPPSSSQALIDLIAELKMIKSMQVRVYKRTELWGKRYQGEQAQEANIITELRNLAERQMRIYQVTHNIAKGKNQ